MYLIRRLGLDFGILNARGLLIQTWLALANVGLLGVVLVQEIVEQSVCLFRTVLFLLDFWPSVLCSRMFRTQGDLPRGFSCDPGHIVRGVTILQQLVENLVLFLQ